MSITIEEEPQEVWVKVTSRKGRRSRTKPALTAPAPCTLLPSPSTLSLEQVKQDHDRLASQWKSSPSYGKLQELLSSNTAIVGNSVATAICFGLGTFDPPDGAWEQKRKAHIQLAAFLAIVEHLQRQASHKIRCVFQEPILNSVDEAFIESLGHEVIDSPAGFQLVDPKTLAFGVHLYRDIYSQVISTHIPAMFIGTAYGTWEE